ncbi:uncharacterized protein ACNLHF_012907 isoform 1-T4 [Anomaloglossus baeobatrachus]
MRQCTEQSSVRPDLLSPPPQVCISPASPGLRPFLAVRMSDVMDFNRSVDMALDLCLLRARAVEKERIRRWVRRRRRYWLHPLNARRLTRGGFCALYPELCEDPQRFLDYFHVSKASFDDLLGRLQRVITKQDGGLGGATSAEERLMLTLRFLATGQSRSSLHSQFGVGIYRASVIVRETCRALWAVLQPDVLPLPTTEQWLAIAEKFMEICHFPNCVGAVGGKHIRIIKPSGGGSRYYNDKKYFSVVLMAIADAQYRFIAVDIGAYVRSILSQRFMVSPMGRRIYGNDFNFPQPRPLPDTSGPPLPFVVVGDKAFQMSENLLTPYSSHDLNPTRQMFNYRLTRAQRMVEGAFGLMTAKWRILTKAIQLDTADDVIKACVVLHNYVLAKETLVVDPDDAQTTLDDYFNVVLRPPAAIYEMRDRFADYFTSDAGRVAWQDECV